jgi:hypothetical protein
MIPRFPLLFVRANEAAVPTILVLVRLFFLAQVVCFARHDRPQDMGMTE